VNVFPRNPLLSDHFLLTFEFSVMDYTASGEKIYYSRRLSDNTVSKFKERIPSVLSPLPCINTVGNSSLNFTSTQVGDLVDSTVASLRATLDTVAPLRKKVVSQRRLAPWYNSETRALKQNSRKLERRWRSTNLEESLKAWKDSLLASKKASVKPEYPIIHH